MFTTFNTLSCSESVKEETTRFEAEGAFLYCHPNNQIQEWSIQAIENLKASNNQAVEYIRKGDSIIWGIKSDKEVKASINLRISFPLKWATSEGPSPTDFIFDNIYELTLNNEKISFPDVNVFKDETSENIYNYNYWIDFSHEVDFINGENVLKLTKIIGNNEYASTGNVDFIDVISASNISKFSPQENPSTGIREGSLEINNDEFIKNEPILVKATPLKGVKNQVVALFTKNSSLFTDKPLFKFDVFSFTNKFENILLHPYGVNVTLGVGSYKIVLMDELTSSSYYTIYIDVIEEHLWI